VADPFLAEIRMFPFDFVPKGWAWCDGQLLPLSQNTALFALLGTAYGGDGKSTFALPDLQGRVPMHPDQGPGLSLHDLGESGGSETVTLLESEIPFHNHAFNPGVRPADSINPTGLASGTGNALYVAASGATLTPAAPQALAPAGASLPHNNMQPYLTVHFCIALQGVCPQRP
jgi:microcystin-dependent protein